MSCIKQPKCPATKEWIKKILYIYTMTFQSAIKWSEIVPFADTWMDLETVKQTSKSKREKQIMCNITYKCGIQKNDRDELTCKAETETQKKRRKIWIPRGEEGVG